MQPGDEVIVPANTYIATILAITENNLVPVCIEPKPNTLEIDDDLIEAAITPRTTAIMPVHVYGKPCDTKAIQDIADKYGLKVIYDAAHAFADYINQPENAAKCFEYIAYYCTNKAAEPYISDEMKDTLVVPDTVTEGEIIQNISQEAEDLHAENWNKFKTACE